MRKQGGQFLVQLSLELRYLGASFLQTTDLQHVAQRTTAFRFRIRLDLYFILSLFHVEHATVVTGRRTDVKTFLSHVQIVYCLVGQEGSLLDV